MLSRLSDLTYPVWERLFSEQLSFRKRLVGGFAIAIAAYFTAGVLYHQNGTYFSFVVIIAAFGISLFAGEKLALFFAAVLSIAGDYSYIPPIGGILETPKSIEHFLIVFMTSLMTAFFVGTIRTAFQKLATAKASADRAKAHADKATEQMEKVLALVSHDVRNPLATSKLAAQMVLEMPSHVDRHNLMGMIVRNLDRADELIQSLLDITKIKTSGKSLNLNFQQCDLRSNIFYLIEEMSLAHKNRLAFESGEPVWGSWGTDGVKRAMENLINNAIKYGASDSPIQVSLCRKGANAVVCVHNRGNEIKLDDQERLFDFFHRADSAEQSSQQGWGIGLAVVKAVAVAHGGNVTVESGSGRGTTFTLTLCSQDAKTEAPNQVI